MVIKKLVAAVAAASCLGAAAQSEDLWKMTVVGSSGAINGVIISQAANSSWEKSDCVKYAEQLRTESTAYPVRVYCTQVSAPLPYMTGMVFNVQGHGVAVLAKSLTMSLCYGIYKGFMRTLSDAGASQIKVVGCQPYSETPEVSK
jgi:hypothetical protein